MRILHHRLVLLNLYRLARHESRAADYQATVCVMNSSPGSVRALPSQPGRNSKDGGDGNCDGQRNVAQPIPTVRPAVSMMLSGCALRGA